MVNVPPRGFFPRTRAQFSLKRNKLRQSWNKINLYNISRYRAPRYEQYTLFKQKWTAKSDSRAYHGNQVREKKWERMFSKRIDAVVGMHHRDLASNDGSKEAAGRGSGVEEPLEYDEKGNIEYRRLTKRTPFMQMAYAPLERRLDSAIHRALFASSIRQARQFVLHGAVKVNGKPMKYSGYLLNPGDMFQVDPDLVMYAAGAKKLSTNERRAGRSAKTIKDDPPKRVKKVEETATEAAEQEEATASDTQKAEVVAEPDSNASEPAKSGEVEEETPAARLPKLLLELARQLGPKYPPILTPSQRLDHRRFQQKLRLLLSRSESDPEQLVTVDGQLDEISSELSRHVPSLITNSPELKKDSKSEDRRVRLLAHDRDCLRAALDYMRRNPVNDVKSYATPWRPRDFLSAFAFIPRFLEVNQKICSAVYIQHPVARSGLADVPSPFGFDTHQLAFNWYLRRR